MSTDALVPARFDRRELAGALGDLGTLLPLASLLVTVNGVNPTVLFGVVGAAYVLSGAYYRLPMPVQPLKSFTSLAIGLGLGVPAIAAGAAVMGACLLAIGLSGAADWVARGVPRPLVRGIQLGVGIILVRAGARMAIGPLGPYPGWLAPALAVATGALILALAKSARWPAGLVTIAGGAVLGLLLFGAPRLGFGPVAPRLVLPAGDDFWTATVLLVLPQLPLTLANSITATRDVARAYFGAEAARRVTGRALTVGLGAANLVAGAAGGMPVCHGSGGMTAHVRLGARSGGSGILIGALLLAAAVGCGPGIAALAGVIPRPVLGALLIYVGVAHGMLVRDVRGASDWTVVAATGVVGGATLHNGYGLLAGIVMLAAGAAARRWRAARKGRAARGAA